MSTDERRDTSDTTSSSRGAGILIGAIAGTGGAMALATQWAASGASVGILIMSLGATLAAALVIGITWSMLPSPATSTRPARQPQTRPAAQPTVKPVTGAAAPAAPAFQGVPVVFQP